MNLHSSTNRKPTVLSKGIRLAGFGAVAAASALLFSTESAHAGAAELKALVAALKAVGKTTTDATPDELAAAVNTVLTNNSKLKPGVVAGEALKTPASVSFQAGDEIAAVLLNRVTDAASRSKLVGDAAKTATTGKGGTAQQVPVFSSAFLQDTNQAVVAAEVARASKLAVGAILGGFATTQPEAQRAAIATAALTNPKLAAAASDISRFVGSTFSDAGNTDEFALTIAQSSPKLVSKILPGVAAAAPTNAGEITRKVLTQTTSQDLATNFQKTSAAIVKAVAAVADIEQISLIGAYISDAIGNNVKGPNGKELVSLKSAVSLTTTLAKAIVAKPTTSGSGPLSATNKSDEVAEVAAYVVAGILGNNGLTEKTAGKLIVSIVKAAVAGGKTTKKQTPLDADYIRDIAGSVANTLKIAAETDVISSALRDAIKLALEKGAKTIAGKSASLVTTGLTEGFAGTTPVGKTETNPAYENGFDLAAIVDPETDNKNF